MHSILIVDDEAGIREILSRFLTLPAYTLREAPDAEAALAVMAESPADVVLCDIEMPGQGGLWLAEQLRARFPHTAIILATAIDTIPPTTSMQSGIVEYIVKPFERSLVLRAVTNAIAWREAELAKPPARTDGAARLEEWINSDGKDP
ncbi:MAG: response regulator [Acidobacteriota bacterium]|nr:response regulator [Acidobacteriota bacterium]